MNLQGEGQIGVIRLLLEGRPRTSTSQGCFLLLSPPLSRHWGAVPGMVIRDGVKKGLQVARSFFFEP